MCPGMSFFMNKFFLSNLPHPLAQHLPLLLFRNFSPFSGLMFLFFHRMLPHLLSFLLHLLTHYLNLLLYLCITPPLLLLQTLYLPLLLFLLCLFSPNFQQPISKPSKPKPLPQPHSMATCSKTAGLLSNPHCFYAVPSSSIFAEPVTYK